MKLTWVGNPVPIETTVTRAEPSRTLEFNDIRWQLEPHRRWHAAHALAQHRSSLYLLGAAGWHICFEVLTQVLSGIVVARIAGGDAVKSERWQRLRDEYAKQFTRTPRALPNSSALENSMESTPSHFPCDLDLRHPHAAQHTASKAITSPIGL